MKHAHLVIIVLSAALATACASRPVKTETSESAPATKAAPPREAPKKEAPKEVIKEAPVESEVIGKPAPDSKFAKLKTGMPLNQVEKLIGPPTKRWTHPTGKASIPFYFGPDRWVIQYAYKNEGVLTFNSGGEQLLTRIEVNKGE